MKLSKTLLMAASVFALSISSAQAFSDAEKSQIKEVVKELLKEEPGLVIEAMTEYRIQETKREAEAAAENLKKYEDYFKRADAPIAGNPKGDIVVVEFFDYNCGYCKRAFDDLAKLIQDDDRVKVIFQEMPILGPSSQTMAEYSLAAKRQDKYFEFHIALMSHKGGKTDEDILKLAEKAGLDTEKLKKDAKSDEVAAEIAKSKEVAIDLGIRGTPAFIIDGSLERGYLGPGGLKNRIKEIEAEKAE